MATEVRIRRGTTAQHTTFTGANGEITVDTSKKTLVVHDGATPGGFPLAREGDNTAMPRDISTLPIDAAIGGSELFPVYDGGEARQSNITKLTTYIASQIGGGGAAVRNLLTNSLFWINQRTVSGTVTLTAGQFGHDRWKAGASGCTYTFSTSAGVTTITISAGSLQQVVPGDELTSGNVVLSWSGTAQGRIGTGAYGATGVPTASATEGTNLTVEFNTGTLFKPQLQSGLTASAYVKTSKASDYLAAVRFYYRFTNSSVNTFWAAPLTAFSATRLFVSSFTLPTKMASTPTVTFSNINTYSTAFSLVQAVTTMATYTYDGTAICIDSAVASGLTAGTTYNIGIAQNGFLAFSAEI